MLLWASGESGGAMTALPKTIFSSVHSLSNPGFSSSIDWQFTLSHIVFNKCLSRGIWWGDDGIADVLLKLLILFVITYPISIWISRDFMLLNLILSQDCDPVTYVQVMRLLEKGASPEGPGCSRWYSGSRRSTPSGSCPRRGGSLPAPPPTI